jgi:mono/diheme cytochrome c family protein
MKHLTIFALASAALVAAGFILSKPNIEAKAAESQVERGKYLVTFGGCMDCHTPGYFFGKPDMTRYLGGSEVASKSPASARSIRPI